MYPERGQRANYGRKTGKILQTSAQKHFQLQRLASEVWFTFSSEQNEKEELARNREKSLNCAAAKFCMIIQQRVPQKLEFIFCPNVCIRHQEVSTARLKGMTQDPVRGKCNLPALTWSADPQPRADGIQFQSTGLVIARCGPEALQVIFLWPSLIGILTTVLSLVVDHPSTHMKSLKCDIAITVTVTHGRKSRSANRDPARFFSSLHWKEKRNFQ